MLSLQENKAGKVVIKKEVNQWYDVGIIKQTQTVVGFYHLPSEAAQRNEDVSKYITRDGIIKI